MTNTGSSESGLPNDLPKGFEPAHAPKMLGTPYDIHPTWLTGNGSVYSTAQDLLKWGIEVKTRLVNSSGWRPYGWGIRNKGKELYIEQNGRIPGYASSIKVYPESDLIVIALSRIESGAVNSMADGIADLALGSKVEVPAIRELKRLSKQELDVYQGVYQITPDFLVSTSASKDGLGIATGSGENLHFAALDPLGEDRFFFRVGSTSVSFARNKDGSISGLYWGGSGPFPKIK